MVSQKNHDLKNCIKCNIRLTNDNWSAYSQKASHYICRECRKIQDKARYQNSPDYNKKQLARYRSRRSAVIHSYGDTCINCGEDDYYKLTIDHKNNDGYLNKKQIVNNIVDWLYNNPIQRDGYQVLCYSCNYGQNVTYKDKYALRDKKKVMEAYGNKCAECDEHRIERLTINHKNNDGAEQRRQLKCYTGVRMYRWLIKNNYPTNLGLRILCYNCNCRRLSDEAPDYCLTGFNE